MMSDKEPGQMAREVWSTFVMPNGQMSDPNKVDYDAAWAAVESTIRADEAAKVRAATIEECAKVAKTAWLTCPYGEIADADAMCALSEHTETAIRALAEK